MQQQTFTNRHTVSYSVRSFDAEGQLYEDENFLHHYLGSRAWQFGVIFRIGN